MGRHVTVSLVLVLVLLAIAVVRGQGPRTEKMIAQLKVGHTVAIQFDHKPRARTNAREPLPVSIDRVETPRGLVDARILYRIASEEAYRSVPLTYRGGRGTFSAEIPGMDRGRTVQYYLRVTDAGGEELVLPDNADLGGAALETTFRGRAPLLILYLFAVMAYGAAFLLLLSFFLAADHLKGTRPAEEVFPAVLGGVAGLLLAVFPLGWYVSYAATGRPWGGAPFSWGLFENRALLLFAFWGVTLLGVRHRLTGSIESNDLLTERAFSALVMMGSFLTIIFYHVPLTF